MTARRAALAAVVILSSACSVGTRDADVTVPEATAPPSPTATQPATAAVGTLVIDDGGIRTFDCAGRDVHITEGVNLATLRGTCPSLVIDSDGNVVDVERVGSIVFNANSNVISYGEAIDALEPAVEDNGTLNIVEPDD